MASSSVPKVAIVGAHGFRSNRNLWLLEELGVEYDWIKARPRSKEAFAYSAFGKIPALKDGAFIMYESAAINTYLADKYRGRPGQPDLVPEAGTPLRGVYEQKVLCIASELDAQGLWMHRKHEALAGILAPACPEAVSHARGHVKKVFKILAAELKAAEGDFLLGATFSAADVLLGHCMDWATSIGWADDWADLDEADASVLTAYHARCQQRPAYIKMKRLGDSK